MLAGKKAVALKKWIFFRISAFLQGVILSVWLFFNFYVWDWRVFARRFSIFQAARFFPRLFFAGVALNASLASNQCNSKREERKWPTSFAFFPLTVGTFTGYLEQHEFKTIDSGRQWRACDFGWIVFHSVKLYATNCLIAYSFNVSIELNVSTHSAV